MQKCLWDIKAKDPTGQAIKSDELITHVLNNRGLTTPKEQEDFLNPNLNALFKEIPFPEMDKAVARIKEAIANKEKISIYSDYDADGINATAILWETLHKMGADVTPYMPHRMTEGYGISISGVELLAEKGVKLIITVDNGITAVAPVNRATELGVEVIITDHHQKPVIMPKPHSFVWSDKICGAGVAFVLSKHLTGDFDSRKHLDLAALATITDVMPLQGFNRAIVIEGIKELNITKRVGLQAMFHEANIEQGKIGSWEIGHVIGPRLNAMGRLDNAIDSLRLLCTNNPLKAKSLCLMLSQTNSERQKLTEKMVEDAKLLFEEELIVGVLASDGWHEGVVGLVAGRMTERHYRPMLAIAKGETFSKGSARSIPGFNIIEALRSLDGVFENVGGHPMAAGFTIRTDKIAKLKADLNRYAKKNCNDSLLKRKLSIDAILRIADIHIDIYRSLKLLEPFGNANLEPVLLTKELVVEEIKKVGQKGQHAKLIVTNDESDSIPNSMGNQQVYQTKFKPHYEAIGFNMSEILQKIRPGDRVDIAYTLDLNVWNNISKLQMKMKDIRFSS